MGHRWTLRGIYIDKVYLDGSYMDTKGYYIDIIYIDGSKMDTKGYLRIKNIHRWVKDGQYFDQI